MSEEQLEYDPEWTLATLNDAKEALEDLIAQVEDSPEEVKEILERKHCQRLRKTELCVQQRQRRSRCVAIHARR